MIKVWDLDIFERKGSFCRIARVADTVFAWRTEGAQHLSLNENNLKWYRDPENDLKASS